MPTYQHFTFERNGDVTVVRLVDPQHFNDFGTLHVELLDFLAQERPANLLIDFSRISYCSTAVFNALLMIAKETGRKLKLTGMNEMICEQFRTLKLEGTVFQLFDSCDEALAAYDGAATAPDEADEHCV